MKTAPKLIIDVGKQLNFLLNLWCCRSHREGKHSQSLNSALSGALTTGSRTHWFLCISCRSKRGDSEEGLETPLVAVSSAGLEWNGGWFSICRTLTGLLTLTEWKSHQDRVCKLWGASSFLLLCNALRFAFLVIQCFLTNPSRLGIWTLSVHENKTPTVCAQIYFLCNELSILCFSFPAETLLNIMLHWA